MSYFRMPVLFCQEENSGNLAIYANSTRSIEGGISGMGAALSYIKFTARSSQSK